MLVKYYKDNDLKYASRKRFKDITKFAEIASERQQAILLGDGANTQVKTFSANICDYVTIDGTRWFVTSYEYLNGGQVRLNLQRDVIGEFGLDGCYGQVQRGFTNSILQNRKELSLNQILKKRTPLISTESKYGNYEIDNHKDELWGILYLSKPTSGEESVNINIPAFAPKIIDYPFIQNNTKFRVLEYPTLITVTVPIRIRYYNSSREIFYNYYVRINFSDEGVSVSATRRGDITNFCLNYQALTVDLNKINPYNDILKIAENIADDMFEQRPSNVISFPAPEYNYNEAKYDGKTIELDNSFLQYSSTVETFDFVGGYFNGDEFSTYIVSRSNLRVIRIDDKEFNLTSAYGTEQASKNIPKYNVYNYTYRYLSPEESGTIVINLNKDFVDEPYYILAFPLYYVTIRGNNREGTPTNYNVGKQQAFNIFNTVIQYLSGAKPYLVDAQIYPYCPELTSVASELNDYPFFEIESTAFDRKCNVKLNQNLDIKKEYIEKTYSLISPEQTGKFDFNVYDYITEAIEDKEIEILIKTALKPFSIISSAIVIPEQGSLKGITYGSDLRGCQPSSNGFECSLSTNEYQQYLRQNSNYQQIFALQKEELQMQHQVERVNEKTQAVVNTITATGMGAIGGANIGSAFGPIAGAIGAAVGGTVAGATVGTAMAVQYNQNEKLRQYEEKLQQQTFDLEIGTIKNLPNSISRISSFNEIILKDFYYVVETYECSDYEKELVDEFIEKYGYGLGVYGFYKDFFNEGWFLRGTLITSNLAVNLHNIAENEFNGGIYYYEQE